MDNYVVSRELAEKLRDAGYPQKTQFGYDFSDEEDQCWFVVEQSSDIQGNYLTAAPLSDELLELLPVHTELRKPLNGLGGGYDAVLDSPMASKSASFWQYKPADALASLWLWCKEHNYV